MKKLKEEWIEGMRDLDSAVADIVVSFEDWWAATDMNWADDDESYTGGMDSKEEAREAAIDELLSFIRSSIESQLAGWDDDFDYDDPDVSGEKPSAEDQAFFDEVNGDAHFDTEQIRRSDSFNR